MIKPSISELTQDGKINRYTLVIATAKSARIITDEYVKQREYAEKITMSKDNEKAKNLASFIKKEYRDEKAVKNAINGLYNGEFRILSQEEAELLRQKKAAEEEQKKSEFEAADAAADEDAADEEISAEDEIFEEDFDEDFEEDEAL